METKKLSLGQMENLDGGFVCAGLCIAAVGFGLTGLFAGIAWGYSVGSDYFG